MRFEHFKFMTELSFMIFHLCSSQCYYYYLYWMAELRQLIISKNKPISSDQLAGIIKIFFSQLQEDNLNALLDIYVPQKTQLTIPQSLEIAQIIISQVAKLQPRGATLIGFYCNSLMKLENNRILVEDLDIPSEFDLNSEFKDIVGESFYKKLINYGSTGLLFIKNQDKPHRKYTFFQWVQYNLDLTANEDSDSLYQILLKQIWSFKFSEIMDTLTKIKMIYPQDKEASSMEVGLRVFVDVYALIIGNEELKDKFIDRKHFNINYENEHNNKREEKDFNNKINEVKQQLLFGSNYFLFLRDSFKNKFYYAIAIFLGNRDDNYLKQHDLTISIQEISIVDRFFYARKFYRSQDFQALKKKLLEAYTTISVLDYIILFGTRKQSEQILQNYIDKSSQIQKVAVISVLLKILLQSKMGPKDTKIAFYNKFIRCYQTLLVNIDSGILKHKFDKKCIAIQVERKKKTMSKTFDFNCLHCKSKQCLLSVTKRIGSDSKQSHPRMKGNNIFLKDQRNQVMYCLDCMQLLPKCSVCLFQITVYNGYAEQAKKNNTPGDKYKNQGESLDNALVWCPQCFHGGHFNHITKWMQMSDKKKCAVASCKCRCQF